MRQNMGAGFGKCLGQGKDKNGEQQHYGKNHYQIASTYFANSLLISLYTKTYGCLEPYLIPCLLAAPHLKGLPISREALNLLVRLARVERATLCLGGRCSIQLSYNRRSNVPIYYNAIVQYFARRNYSPQRFPQATWLRIAARQEIPVRHLLAFLCFLRLRRCSSMEITLSFFATAFWAAFRARWAAFSLSRSS